MFLSLLQNIASILQRIGLICEGKVGKGYLFLEKDITNREGVVSC
jgi:hypothetical protein